MRSVISPAVLPVRPNFIFLSFFPYFLFMFHIFHPCVAMFSNVTVICILFTSSFTFVPLLFIFLMIYLVASFHALCCALPAAVMIQLSTMDHYCISYTASTRSAKQIFYLIQSDLQLIEQLEGQDSSICSGIST